MVEHEIKKAIDELGEQIRQLNANVKELQQHNVVVKFEVTMLSASPISFDRPLLRCKAYQKLM